MKHKKKLSLLLALALGVTPVLTSINQSQIFAEENENYEEKITKEIENEFKFYFETIGHLENGKYIITNPYLLKQKAISGDKFAKELYANYTNRSVEDYIICILNDYVFGYGDLIEGRYYDAFKSAIIGGSWAAAAKIMVTAMTAVGKTVGKYTNWAYTAAAFAMSAVTCKDKW